MNERLAIRRDDSAPNRTPVLAIFVGIEREPRIYVSAASEGQEIRLADWISNRAELWPPVDQAIRDWIDSLPRLRDAA